MTRSRVLGLLFIAIIVIAVPLTVFILKQQQDVRQRASVEDPNIVALVGTEAITKSEIDDEIRKGEPTNMESALLNQALRKEKLEQLIEEKLVRQEAKKKQVTATASDINEEKEALIDDLPMLVASDPAQLETEELSTKVLSDNVRAKVVTSRTIDMFFVNKSPADPLFNQQLATAKTSLEVIRKLLQDGKASDEAYVLAQKTAGFDKNIQFTSGEVIEADSTLMKRFKDPLFTLHKNAISSVMDSFGGTLILVKVVNENNTNYTSYDAWLTDMKKQSVVIK